MFHFRLKSDKKPNGTKINAVQHVDYIRREGNYSEVEKWEENNKFVGNYITTEENQNVLGSLDVLLYKTDEFGSIRNTENGIEVTESASPTTISIALTLADETMNHQPLILNGSHNFKKMVLEAAIQADLKIKFANRRLNDEFVRRKNFTRVC